MSNQQIGIIGGSGVYNIEGVEIVKEHQVSTPYGEPSSPVMEAELEGVTFFFIPRHGKQHSFTPSEVNYRANIYALKALGVEYIISVSAVGSLKEELPPTTFVLVDQFIDWTKGKRERTFFGNGIVAHVSEADPTQKELRELMVKACVEEKLDHHEGGTYICIEGPQFSTRAESKLYQSFGASVIGMTNVPEAFLAKEAGIAYATVAMVTDFDGWKDEHCTVEEIMNVMKTNNANAQKLLKNLLPSLQKNKFKFEKQNAIGIMTPKENWTDEQKEIMKVLLA